MKRLICLLSYMITSRVCVARKGLSPCHQRIALRKGTLKPHRAFGIDVSQFEGVLDEETSYRVVYGGLGLIASSFVATFFVAPNFRSSLKESEEWKDIYADLVEKRTESISPLRAMAKLSQPNAVLLDVSLESRFQKKSAKGAINIPLYQPIQGWDLASTVRRLAFAFFGIPGTERNPSWLSTVEETISKDQEVVVMCELGGTLEKKVGMDTGFQSRSLKAVHFLQQAGYQNVLHLKGGFPEWVREELPTNTT